MPPMSDPSAKKERAKTMMTRPSTRPLLSSGSLDRTTHDAHTDGSSARGLGAVGLGAIDLRESVASTEADMAITPWSSVRLPSASSKNQQHLSDMPYLSGAL